MSAANALDVIIVGAGIAGLTAAIALRRAGHRVKIYERSDLSNEFGAAIHLCPNASRILLAWGMDPVRARFVVAKTTYIADGKSLHRIYENEYSAIESTYGAPWFLAHRVDLHTELKRLATDPDGLGTPAVLISNARVISYDSHTGSVTLTDSTTQMGDIVVAADGVHSKATEVVLGVKTPALPTNQTAFRFLIPSRVLSSDSDTAHFLEGDDGRFKVFIGDDGKRLVWYPCRDNEEQNFVGIFHDQDKNMREDWNAAVDQNELLEEYSNFHLDILAVLKKATSVKKWPLLFRSPITTWYRSKLVLIGDAAHPMLPHQGQAGAQAVEDSAALGIMLGDLTKARLNADPNLLSKRLELFQDVRKNRAAAMQIFSNAGQDQASGIAEAVRPYLDASVSIPKNPAEFMIYNFGHDVSKESLAALKKYRERST